MNAPKIAALAAAVLLCLCGLSAQDAGLDSATSVSLTQRVLTDFGLGERLSPWWRLPLDAGGSEFSGRAHLSADLSVSARPAGQNGSEAAGTVSGDIDSLVLSLVAVDPSAELKRFRLELGRLVFAEPTGLILNHAADGAALRFEYPGLNLSIAAGYTGLVLRNASSISASHYDEALAARPAGDAAIDPVAITGTRRFIGAVALDLPDLLTQKLELSFLMQQDLNPAAALAKLYQTQSAIGGPVDTQYATLQASGPIYGGVYYRAWCSYGFGSMLSWMADPASATGYSYQSTAISSVLAGAKLDWFLPSFMNAAFGARFLYASGDADAASATEGNTLGQSGQFVPLTPVGLGTVFAPKLSNLVFAELSGSLRPVGSLRLQTGAKLMLFFRPTAGAVGASGISPTSASTYLGTELDLFGTYRILSDLGVSLNGGLFFPGIEPAGAFTSTLGAVQYSLKLTLDLGI